MEIKNIAERLKSGKLLPIALIVLAIGIVLMLFVGKGNDKEKEIITNGFTFDFNSYENDLESRISSKLNKLEGVSECETIIILDQSYKFEYVRDDSGEIFVYENDDVEMTLTEREVAPRVRGVAVICRGGERAEIKQKITEMLCALFDISTNDVWVGGKE